MFRLISGKTFPLWSAVVAAFAWPSAAIEIHIDADYSIAHHAADSIELGVRAALTQHGNTIGGETVTLVQRDHRGNVKRSHRHMEQFLTDDDALAMIGGMHSPPYITHRDFMNRSGVLLLVPWAAAGPITRASEGDDNWIFRLSVDDSKAGEFLISQAVDHSDCAAVGLVLIDNGWGYANHKTLSAALKKRGLTPARTDFFGTSIGHATAATMAQQINEDGVDCVVLLSSWDNGAYVVNAISHLDRHIRVFSHWGHNGGPIPEYGTPCGA